MISLRLRLVPGRYAVARLAPGCAVPAWIFGEGFWAIVQADDEMTVICAADRVPTGIEAEAGWSCLRTVGPFGFQQTGIVSALTGALSSAGIGVFVLCTFDGEHLLVAEKDFASARGVLHTAGHRFIGSEA